jgi:excisionase family DNA binding protein
MTLKDCPDVLTPDQLARLLKVSKTTIYRFLRNGEIKHFRIGSAIRIPKIHILEFLNLSQVDKNVYLCYTGSVDDR